MSAWKAWALTIAVVVLLVWLHPPRHLADPEADETAIVEIAFMGPGGPISGAMADVVRAFEQESQRRHEADPSHPIYRVVSGQNAARDQVGDPTRFLVSVAGGMPPDVIWFDRFAIAEWAARGAFEPLDAFIEADRVAGREDYPRPERFYEATWQEAVHEGKVYGIPVSVDTRALFYNEDLLSRAGLVYTDGPREGEARPPHTWEELAEYTVRLTEWEDEQKTKLKVVGFSPTFGNSFLYIFGWMNGAEFLSPDGRDCLLDAAPVVEALAYMRSLVDSIGGFRKVQGFLSSFQGTGVDAVQDPFILGQVAMKIDGIWTLPRLATYGRDLNFGVVPPPLPADRLAALPPDRREAHLTMSFSGGWALAIPSTAKNKQAAWDFIRFVTSDRGFRLRWEADRQIAEAQGRPFLPNQCPVKHLNEAFYEQYVAGNAALPRRFGEAIAVFNDLLPYSYYRPVTAVGQRLWKGQLDATEAAFYGESPEAALRYQDRIVQRELDRFHAPPTGVEIRSWAGFFAGYALLLIAMGVAAYLWDTNVAVRRRLAALLPWRTGFADAVIPGSRGGYFRRQWKEGVICASPWILGFVVFGGGPILFAVVMSVCNYDVINPPRFTGVENYRVMLFEDHLFWKSLWNTTFMLLGVPLGMAVSLAIALLMNTKVAGMSAWRTLFYLPAIVPLVASSVLWVWIFNPQNGLINGALELVGLTGPSWLQDVSWARPAIILMGLWGAGAGMIIWLAGLQGIPASLYEAAAVDGANAWRRFRHVTLPQLTPYIFFNAIMGVIATFQIFAQAFIMTGGGPNNATLFYVYHLFNNAFRYGQMGYASAMAMVLFVIVLALTIVQFKLSHRWVHYEAD